MSNLNINKNISVRLNTFDERAPIKKGVKSTVIHASKIKIFFESLLKNYCSLGKFVQLSVSILVDSYFDSISIDDNIKDKTKNFLVDYCSSAIEYFFGDFDKDRLNDILFLSTWFYSDDNIKNRSKELSYFNSFFKDNPSNSFYFMKKIYSCTDRSYLYSPIKKLRDNDFYLDAKEKSKLKGIDTAPSDGSYLSLSYSDQQYFNFYFIAGYFLVKLISLPYLQSVKTQQTSPEVN